MKKWFAFILAVLLIVNVAGVSFAAEYTLPEKMEKQLSFGSGIKGSATFTLEGEGKLVDLLKVLNNVEIQIRGIQAGNSDDYLYSLYREGENDEQLGMTQLYIHNGEYIFLSPAWEYMAYSMLSPEQTWDLMNTGDHDNISSDSFLSKMLMVSDEEWELKWEKLMSPYYKMIEGWMSGFANSPVTEKTEDGSTVIRVSYVIDENSLKKGVCDLWEEVLADDVLVSLIGEKMTPEQKQLYLNRKLMYFYREALNSAVLGGDVILTRTVSTKGDVVDSAVELPLVNLIPGYDRLKINSEKGITKYTMTGANDASIVYIPGEMKQTESGSTVKSSLVVCPAGEAGDRWYNSYLAYDILVEKETKAGLGEDGKEHQYDTVKLNCVPNTELVTAELQPLYTDLKALDADFILHYSSKTAQSSPTTLEINGKITMGDEKVSLTSKIKTAASWELVIPSYGQVTSVIGMNVEQIDKVISELFSGLVAE